MITSKIINQLSDELRTFLSFIESDTIYPLVSARKSQSWNKIEMI